METDVFYGAASGQQRSALRRLEPARVMISYATACNTPWSGNYSLFVDSGGYHHMISGEEYDTTNTEYLEYVLEHRPDLWALRDYPCERDLLRDLGRTVENQQSRTTEKHVELLNTVSGHKIENNAVSVLQGWTVEQYLTHLDELRDRGCLTNRVGIGTMCRRDKDKELAKIILSVRSSLPDRCDLHAFGIKGSVLRFQEVVEALDSVDSAAYDWSESRFPSERSTDSFTWRDSARAYLNWRHKLRAKCATESLEALDAQTTLV